MSLTCITFPADSRGPELREKTETTSTGICSWRHREEERGPRMLGVSLSSQEEGIRRIRATQTSAPHYQLCGLDPGMLILLCTWGGIEMG